MQEHRAQAPDITLFKFENKDLERSREEIEEQLGHVYLFRDSALWFEELWWHVGHRSCCLSAARSDVAAEFARRTEIRQFYPS